MFVVTSRQIIAKCCKMSASSDTLHHPDSALYARSYAEIIHESKRCCAAEWVHISFFQDFVDYSSCFRNLTPMLSNASLLLALHRPSCKSDETQQIGCMQVFTPARQFPTAAAEFWSRIQHAASVEDADPSKLSIGDAAGQLSSLSPISVRQPGQEVDADRDEEEHAGSGGQHQGMGLQHSEGASRTQSGGADSLERACLAGKAHEEEEQCEACRKTCSEEEQPTGVEGRSKQQPSRTWPVWAPTWASDRAHACESELQLLTHSRAVADHHSRSRPASSTLSRPDMQQGQVSSAQTDGDLDDDMMSHDGSQGSQQPFASQLQGKEGIRRFLARLHKPKSMPEELPTQQQPRPLLLQPQQEQQQQQQSLMQQQLPMQTTLGQQHTALQYSGLATESGWQSPAANPSESSRYSCEHSEDVSVSSQQALAANAHSQSAFEAAPLDAAANAALSPVEAAVSAVVGRLQSVQLGLASAEDRLVLLTGRKAAKRYQNCQYHNPPVQIVLQPFIVLL